MTKREAIEIISRPFSMQETPKEILDAHRLAISALEKQEADRWTPMKERLPDVNEKVLVTFKDGNLFVRKCDDVERMQYYYSNAVAWRPLPEPYTEEEA